MASEPGSGATFSFTLPLYVLPKLLFPRHHAPEPAARCPGAGKARPAPAVQVAAASWKETCARCLDLLQRCVYLDKDLVLPPMAVAGTVQPFFVVASTNLEGAEVMMDRIRGQMENMPELTASGEFELSASAVPLPELPAEASPLKKQVAEVAERVTEMVRAAVATPRTVKH